MQEVFRSRRAAASGSVESMVVTVRSDQAPDRGVRVRGSLRRGWLDGGESQGARDTPVSGARPADSSRRVMLSALRNGFRSRAAGKKNRAAPVAGC